MKMKKYGLIGEKLGHSFSPYLHSRLGEYDYRLYELREEEIPGFLKSEDIAGVNVTIPYKQTVLKYCNELSDKVKKIGSANTLVKKDDGTLYADNTDYDGFEYILDKTDADVRGKKILVLGSGGASKAVCSVLRDKKAEVVIISRRGENNYGNLTKHRDAYAVVNTTPVGMYPNVDASPVDLTVFPCLRYVLDLIYNPYKTKLLIQAEEMGLVYINGSDMLVEQARVAAEIFSGHAIDPEVVRDISSDMTRNALDVTLIGMPGCGKTTIGRLLAEKLGRRFIDIDEEIVRLTDFDDLTSTLPLMPQTVGKLSNIQNIRRIIRDVLIRHGFYDTVNYTLVNAKYI